MFSFDKDEDNIKELRGMGFFGFDLVYLVMFLNVRFILYFFINDKDFEGIMDIGVDKSIILFYWWFKSWFVIKFFYFL